MSYEKLKQELRDKRLGLSKNINVPNNNQEVSNDDYLLDEKWQKAKRIIEKIEPRLYKFIFKGTVDASVDARNNLNELRKLCIELRAGILNQRQDNESNY